MAEEAQQAKRESEKKGKGKFLGLGQTPIMLGIVMIVEAAVLFIGFKFLSSTPPPAVAGLNLDAKDPHGHGTGYDGKNTKELEMVELTVAKFKPPNRRSGRLRLYVVHIVAQAKAANQDILKAKLAQHESLIQDRIRMIVAQSDPAKLDGGVEPGLETFRRQIKYQLDEIVGEGIVEAVLVPQCTPMIIQ